MKIIYLICLLFITNLLSAQEYVITVANLKNATTAVVKKDQKADLSSDEAKSKLIIKVTGEVADLEKVFVTMKGDSFNKITPVKTTGQLEFRLKDAFSNNPGLTSFDVYFEEKIKGKVTYQIGVDTSRAGGGGGEEDNQGPFDGYIGAMASANFIGNNKFLSNLTPVVNFGNVIELIDSGRVIWQLDVNPYLGAEIGTKDSISFIPALMLYGRAGFVINNYLKFSMGKVNVSVMPIGFGLKFIPNLQDSGLTLIQHTLRAGIAFSYSDDLLIGAQITQGWHNLTSESKKNYEKIFTNKATDISYITVLTQLALRSKNADVKSTNYIFFEWRSLLSKKHYAAFTNNAILTLGIRKTFEISAAFRQSNTKKGKRIVHQPM